MASQDWFEKDFYATLGVDSDASAEAIKKSYRKLARKYHPDANSTDPTAEKRFKDIGEAYGVLSDPEQRQQYDAVRAMARGGARFTAGGPGAGQSAGFEDLLGGLFQQGGGRNVRFTTSGGGGHINLEDVLGGMFGPGGYGQGGYGQGGQSAGYGVPPGYGAGYDVPDGADLGAEITISFRQAVEGTSMTLHVDDPVAGRRKVTARLPIGVRDGQRVRIPGKGRPSEYGGKPGDLVVTVHVTPHPVFTLDGLDVRVTVPVTFTEAVFGALIEVPTIDGKRVKIRVPAGTPSGRTLRAKGRGLARNNKTGDLLVTVEVAVPQRIDESAREALQAFADAVESEDPRSSLYAQATL